MTEGLTEASKSWRVAVNSQRETYKGPGKDENKLTRTRSCHVQMCSSRSWNVSRNASWRQAEAERRLRGTDRGLTVVLVRLTGPKPRSLRDCYCDCQRSSRDRLEADRCHRETDGWRIEVRLVVTTVMSEVSESVPRVWQGLQEDHQEDGKKTEVLPVETLEVSWWRRRFVRFTMKLRGGSKHQQVVASYQLMNKDWKGSARAVCSSIGVNWESVQRQQWSGGSYQCLT